MLPLFYSRRHAELFHQLTFNNSHDICVRGIEQPALRFLILFANDENYPFGIVQPFMDGGTQKFLCGEWAAKDLAQEYCIYDLSLQLMASRSGPRK